MTWQYQGGWIATPSNAATVRIELYNYMNSGWVAYDDVRLVSEEQVTKYYYLGGQRIATLHPTRSGVVCAAEACYTISTPITWGVRP